MLEWCRRPQRSHSCRNEGPRRSFTCRCYLSDPFKVSYPNSSSSGFQLFLQFGSHQGLANQHCPAWSWNYVCCQVNLFLFIKLAYADLFVSSWSMILLSTNKLIRIWVGCWVELISIVMWRKVLFHETLYLILLITELKCLNMICLYFVVVEYYFDCNCDTFIEELSNLN